MMIEIIVFVIFVLYFIIGRGFWMAYRYRNVEEPMMDVDGGRLKVYRETIIESWIPVGLLAILVLLTDMTPDRIGLGSIVPHHHKGFYYTVLGLTVLFSCVLLYQTIALRICAAKGRKVKTIADVPSILPESAREKRMWILVSMTAGMTEEILYRGYLFYAMGILFPGLHWSIVMAVSAAVFGIAHLYLGKWDVLKTALFGLMFGVMYLAFGSILPAIIVHFLMDLSGVDIKSVRFQQNPESCRDDIGTLKA